MVDKRDVAVLLERYEDSVEFVITGKPELIGDGVIEPQNLLVGRQSINEAVQKAFQELSEIDSNLPLIRVKFEIKRVKGVRAPKKGRGRPEQRISDGSKAKTHDQLLEELLGQWCVTPSTEHCYIFNKLVRRGTDIYQIVLSGDLQTDGVFLLTDFKLFELIDRSTRVKLPYLRVNDSRLLDSYQRKTLSDLRDSMVKREFITDEEFQAYFVSERSVQKVRARNIPMLMWAD